MRKARDIPLRGAICAAARRSLYHIAMNENVKAGTHHGRRLYRLSENRVIARAHSARGNLAFKCFDKYVTFGKIVKFYYEIPTSLRSSE